MRLPVLLFSLAGPLCLGCGDEDVRTIEKIRIVDGTVRWNATNAERFGFGPPHGSSPHAHGVHGVHGEEAGGYEWKLPEGWEELKPKQFRTVNLRAGDAECYLTELPGEAGGLAANVNRWRQQLKLPALDKKAVAELPRRPFLGTEAVLIDFKGGGKRMMGLLSMGPPVSRFLKMTGPEGAVDGDAFLDLADSLRAKPAPAGKPASADGDDTTYGLAWTAPKGWRQGPRRSMRLVTYYAGKAECYIAVLGGDGGGVIANANRWRQQMGTPPYKREEFQKLQRLLVLGGEAVVVEAQGRYSGMNGEKVEDAVLLGAIRVLRQGAVFIKMIGPRADVEAARDGFEKFCTSVRRKG